MIEFLPPREDAFGERDVADFVGVDGDDTGWDDDEHPRSRWLTALAGVGVVGLLTGGVIAAAPWDDDGASAATSTTVPATSTSAPGGVIAPTPTIAPVSTLPSDAITEPAGWIPGDSSRFQPYGVGSSTGDRGTSSATTFALFTGTDEIGRASGRWLAVDGTPDVGVGGFLTRDAVSVSVGDRRGLLSTASDGVVTLDVEAIDGDSRDLVEVVSHGIDLAAIMAVGSVARLERRTPTAEPTLDLGALAALPELAGLQQHPTRGLFVWPNADSAAPQVSWTGLIDRAGSNPVNVMVVRTDPITEIVDGLVLGRPLPDGTITNDVQQQLDDLARQGRRVELVGGSTPGSITARERLDDGTTLVVASMLRADELLGLVETLRPATPDEWVSLLLDAYNGDLTIEPSTDTPHLTSLGSGDDWTADVTDGMLWIGASQTSTWGRLLHTQGPAVVPYRSFDECYLLLTTTFPSEARHALVLQDAPGGRTGSVVDLHEIDTTGVLAAVVRLEHPELPYSIEWYDEAGAPVEGPSS
ncbi:MAG: hypothetical protein U0Q03_05185 [Acidimicrobiales bacterium]